MNCATTNRQACKRRVNCATTNAFTEVYDILNVRGAMNCATTNRQACKRRYELRDYEQASV